MFSKHVLVGQTGTVFMLAIFTVLWAISTPVYIGWNPLTIACLAVFAIYAIWLYIAAIKLMCAIRKLPSSSPAKGEKHIGKSFLFIFVIEIILIIGAIVVLNILGKPDYVAVTIIFIIGAHGVPLAGIFKKRVHIVIGIIMMIDAVVAIVLITSNQQADRAIGVCTLVATVCIAIWGAIFYASPKRESKPVEKAVGKP